MLDADDAPVGSHNVAALRRLAVQREPQDLQLLSGEAGGLMALAVGAPIGKALQVRVRRDWMTPGLDDAGSRQARE